MGQFRTVGNLDCFGILSRSEFSVHQDTKKIGFANEIIERGGFQFV